MRHGPFVFLGLLFALALSWLGMIVTPQFQIGASQPTNLPPAGILYPTATSGLANQGRDVYRANGCSYCHTRVVRQEGMRLDVVIVNSGTNAAAVIDALRALNPGFTPAAAAELVGNTPSTVLSNLPKTAADAAQKELSNAGAEAAVRLIPLGPDIERGWGTRQTVANDYLYENPLMLGTVRIGPDLTNIGLRRPDKAWHFRHLYNAKLDVPESTMPRYPYLFKVHPRGARPSPDALALPGDDEVVPTEEAKALVAYLLSMHAEPALFEAPGPAPVAAANTDTNQTAIASGPDANTNNPAAPK